MEILSAVSKPVFKTLIALQSFFFARPRLDIDLTNNQESLYGRRSLGPSRHQTSSEPISVADVKYDFEFFWNFDLRIKNNSSKTAYEIKIEKITKQPQDYLTKMDDLASLKEGDQIKLDYKLRLEATMNGSEAEKFSSAFPKHLKSIEIILSYTNESRKRFYTRFIKIGNYKKNEHLLTKPKTL